MRISGSSESILQNGLTVENYYGLILKTTIFLIVLAFFMDVRNQKEVISVPLTPSSNRTRASRDPC